MAFLVASKAVAAAQTFYLIFALISGISLLFVILGKTGLRWIPQYHLEFKNPVYFCQVIQMFFATLYSGLILHSLTAPQSQQSCQLIAIVEVWLFGGAISSMYFFLVSKFRAVAYAPSKFLQWTEKMLVATIFGIPVLDVISVILNKGVVQPASTGEMICVYKADPYTTMTFAVLDMFVNLGFLLLFCIPLRDTLKTYNSSTHPSTRKRTTSLADEVVTSRRDGIVHVIKRNTISTLFSVIASTISMALMTAGDFSGETEFLVIGMMFTGFYHCTNSMAMLFCCQSAWKSANDVSSHGKHNQPADSPKNMLQKQPSRGFSTDSSLPPKSASGTGSSDQLIVTNSPGGDAVVGIQVPA
jgi:hypothetical protein